MTERCQIINADVLDGLRSLPDESVHCCVTSPPYWNLRDYGVEGQIGLEPTPQAHICAMLEVFREVWRVLRKDGTLFLNYGDCYAGNVNGRSAADTKLLSDDDRTFRDKPFGTATGGLKPKDLVGMPWRVALALQEDGWWLRSAAPWVKRSAMPESVTDRPASAVEYVFLLAKSDRYFFDMQAVRRNGDNQASGGSMVGAHRLTAGAEMKRTDRRGHANGTIPYGDRDGAEDGASSRHGASLEATAGRGTRAWRNSDFWFDSVGMLLQGEEIVGYDVNPAGFKEAHFATFPEDLVQPCVLAGTSEKGVCGDCGSPHVRIYVPGKRAEGGAEYRPGDAHGATTRRAPKGGQKEWDARTPAYEAGWSASCKCSAEIVPATVLDPFSGAATTGIVALQYGRNYIGVELNESYVKMSERRLAPYIAQGTLALA